MSLFPNPKGYSKAFTDEVDETLLQMERDGFLIIDRDAAGKIVGFKITEAGRQHLAALKRRRES